MIRVSAAVFAVLLALPVLGAERTLRVGAFEQAPLVTASMGTPGLFDRILDQVAARERWTIVRVPGDFSSLMQWLQAGEIDLLPAVPYSRESEECVRFGRETVMSTWAQVHTSPRAPVQSLLDLQGRAIGVVRDDPYNPELRRIAAQFNMECRFVEFAGGAEALDAVAKRWVDAAAVDRLFAAGRALPRDVEASQVVFAPVQLRFAATSGVEAGILDTLDYHVHAMKANPVSVYHKMLGELLGERGQGRVLGIALSALGGLAVLALISVGGVVALRGQVRRQTRDLSAANVALQQEVLSRGRAEEALQSANLMLKKTLESMLDGLLVLAPEARRIRAWNRAALRLFRVEPGELNDRPMDEWGGGVSPSERIALEVDAKGFFSGEVRLHRSDGSEFPAEMRVAPIEDRDPAGTWVAVIRDIGDRVRAEEGLRRAELQLRQAQKMEALGTLAGGIAHDLNNMLTPIMGYAEMLEADHGEGENRQYYCEQVLKAATRAKSLVRQILTFSRTSPAERRPVALSQVIEETVPLLRATLPAGIEIDVRRETPDDVVFADSGQLQQVVMNLASNAGHAMCNRGGRMTIVVGLHRGPVRGIAGELQPVGESFVRMTVRDTGPGIPSELVSRVFDPFFTTKPKEEGTGMGLAVVHGIVKSYGGTITVETEPGRGAAFHIHLPSMSGAPTAAAIDRVAGMRSGRGRILLVDDEAPIVEMVVTMLSRQGYDVTAFGDPGEALTAFSARPSEFDVVITDYSMPRMTGADLVRSIFLVRPDIPVVLCTGFSESMNRERALALGIRHYLLKPFTVEELTAAVADLIEGAGAGAARTAAPA